MILQLRCESLVGRARTGPDHFPCRCSRGRERPRLLRERSRPGALPEAAGRWTVPSKIGAFVHGSGFHERPEIFGDEFAAEDLRRKPWKRRFQRLFFESLELVLLADVADHGDDFTSIVFLEPRNDDRGVQAARVREHRLLYLLLHRDSPRPISRLLFRRATGWRPGEKRESSRHP